MKITKAVLPVLLAIGLLLAANCSFIGQGQEDMFAPGAAQNCVTALIKKRGQRLRFRSLNIFPKYIVVEVQDPEKPANIDRLDYRNGSFSDPDPVDVRSGPDPAAMVFDPGEVALEKIPELVREARSRAGNLEGGESIHLIIQRWDPAKGVEMTVNISSPRKTANLTADNTGKITDFKIN